MFYSNTKNISLKVKAVNKFFFSTIGIFIVGLSNCVVIDQTFEKIPPGHWRGILEIEKRLKSTTAGEDESKKDLLPADNELIFNFEIIDDSTGIQKAIIKNGQEKIELSIVKFIPLTGLQDSFYIDFPVYQSHLTGYIAENIMSGEWVVRSKENYRIPFTAWYGKNYQYAVQTVESEIDINGDWEIDFNIDGEHPFKGLGIFKQEGNILTGTVKTETGDYRFMSGNVVADQFYLSAFDGAHSFFIRGKEGPNGKLFGSFSNGNHYKVNFVAIPNEDFELGDPNELTFLQEDYHSFSFSFPDVSGKLISSNDEMFKGKPLLVQIMGTWCPNCRDETSFLVEYLSKNNVGDLNIIALAFERYRNKDKAIFALENYKEKLNIPYQLLIAGNSSKEEASEKLPMLNRVISYPTLIFINRNGEVIKIHTGFNGPATDEYEDFKLDFHNTIQALIST